eukprot:TRINITY_DN36114_c0_g1_i1.p1 TRINITY_DN36114_c0_g1~~TRINITY_DN36114_c0_g1_i1.p1  ORF type:complete len:757 (+),score=180.60 TRINITY_DN36114_c0_g1_i1:56-2326(+)
MAAGANVYTPPPLPPVPPAEELVGRPRPHSARTVPNAVLFPGDPTPGLAWGLAPTPRGSYGVDLLDGLREAHSSRTRRPQHVGSHARALPRYAPVERLPQHPQYTPPPATEGAVLCAHEGQLLVCGGADGGRLCDGAVFSYDIRRRRWHKSPKPAIPLQRHGHTAAVLNGSVYVHGGVGITPLEPLPPGTSRHPTLLSSFSRYDLATQDWFEIKREGEPVAHHTCVSSRLRQRLVFFGGTTSAGHSGLVSAYDVAAARWLPSESLNQQLQFAAGNSDTPTPRSGHCAVLWSPPNDLCGAGDLAQYGRPAPEAMVVYGGNVGKRSYTSDAFSYDLETKKWSRLFCGGQHPAPRAGHSGVAIRDNLIIFGGHDHLPQQPGSPEAGSPPSPAAGEVSVQRDHGSAHRRFGDCFTLHLVTLTWRQVTFTGPLSGMISARSGHACALFEDCDRSIRMVVFGGKGEVAPDTDWIDGVDADSYPPPQSGAPRVVCLSDAWLVSVAPPLPAAGSRRRQRSVSRRRPVSARPCPVASDNRPRGAALSAVHAPPRPPGEPAPWTVQTSRATTARDFGEVPRPPHLRTEGLELSTDAMLTAIARLSSTRQQEETRAALEHKYLFRGDGNRQLTKEEQDDFIDRIYCQQLEVRDQFRRQLQQKYFPRKKVFRLTLDQIDLAVARLHKSPTKKDADFPVRRQMRPNTGQEQRVVLRLYHQALQRRQAHRENLFKKFTGNRNPVRLPPDAMVQSVARLHAGHAKADADGR